MTNFLKPEIVYVEGRQYRKVHGVGGSNTLVDDDRRPYVEDEDFYLDEPDCIISDKSLETLQNGSFRDCLHVPSFYFKYIIGRGGEKKRFLEKDTGTNISLPKKGAEGDIIITGTHRSGVIEARTRILNVVDLNRQKQPAEHFLSLSLVADSVTKRFEEFKKEVQNTNSEGVDSNVFQRPQHLHLTLCMLNFLNRHEMEESLPIIESTIKDVYSKHYDLGGFEVWLNGIEYMNDDPGSVDVLYAKVHDHTLQLFADELVTALSNASRCARKEYDRVKLHATLMNTKFCGDNRGRLDNPKHRMKFDARSILKKCASFDFGKIHILSIDVNVRGCFDADDLYMKSATFPL